MMESKAIAETEKWMEARVFRTEIFWLELRARYRKRSTKEEAEHVKRQRLELKDVLEDLRSFRVGRDESLSKSTEAFSVEDVEENIKRILISSANRNRTPEKPLKRELHPDQWAVPGYLCREGKNLWTKWAKECQNKDQGRELLDSLQEYARTVPAAAWKEAAKAVNQYVPPHPPSPSAPA